MWVNNCWVNISIWVFQKIWENPPSHPMFNRVFHDFHHPFWGFPPIFGNIHIFSMQNRQAQQLLFAFRVDSWRTTPWIEDRRLQNLLWPHLLVQGTFWHVCLVAYTIWWFLTTPVEQYNNVSSNWIMLPTFFRRTKKFQNIFNKTHPSPLLISNSSDFFFATSEDRLFKTSWWFQPPTHLKNMQPSNWIISPDKGKNQQCLKPPPRKPL